MRIVVEQLVAALKSCFRIPRKLLLDVVEFFFELFYLFFILHLLDVELLERDSDFILLLAELFDGVHALVLIQGVEFFPEPAQALHPD